MTPDTARPSLRESFAQPVRFGIVGVANTCLDVAAFWLLARTLGTPLLVANSLSDTAGIVNSFILNRLWTFRGIAFRDRAGVQLPRFLLVSLVGLAVANLSLWFFAQLLPVMTAKLLSVAVTFAWNFFSSKRLVFRGATGRQPPTLAATRSPRVPGTAHVPPRAAQDRQAK